MTPQGADFLAKPKGSPIPLILASVVLAMALLAWLL